MKLGTMIGAIATATVLMAIWAAAPASATVMCKIDFEGEAICPAGSVYGTGTAVSASLKTGSASKLNVGFTTVVCEESKMAGEVTANGGPEETVTTWFPTFTFGKCNATTKVAEAFGITFHWKVNVGGTRGYGTFDGLNMSISSGTISCTYGAAEIKGENLMAVKGEPGELKAGEVELPKLSGSLMCANTAKWTATYTVNSPSPFSLAAG
jgi:hypothetical protein